MGIYWTIQSIKKWEEVKNIGYLIGVRDHIWPEFIEPYYWMMQQMAEKLPNYQGEFPVWVWTDRPDLRRSALLNKGSWGVVTVQSVTIKVILHEITVVKEFTAR